MSVQENRSALERAIAAFNNVADRTGYLDIYDPDVVLHGFPPGLPAGIAGARAFYGALWKAFPDGHLVVDDILAEGDRVAAMFRFTATHAGEFMGVPASGKKVSFDGMTFIRFSRSKIVERWNVTDMLSLMQQIGTAK